MAYRMLKVEAWGVKPPNLGAEQGAFRLKGASHVAQSA